LWSVGLGCPDPTIVERCHRAGILVMAMVCTLQDAKSVADTGVDIIVAQGAEAGGHRSTWKRAVSAQAASIGTMALVPQVVDAVSQPVVAAGGIVDGRGLVAACALGAQGAMLGTRFVATRESQAPAMFKRALMEAASEDARLTNAFTGLYARALNNRFIEDYESSGAPVLPSLLQSMAAEDIFAAAGQRGDRDHFPMMAGQSAGLITDLPGAGDVVRRIAAEASATLERLHLRTG
jgi:nitronate monooxygenase